MTNEEIKKAIAFVLFLHRSLPELAEEFNNTKPEWNDEKAYNETLTDCVKTIERM